MGRLPRKGESFPITLEISDLTGRIIFEKEISTQNLKINTTTYQTGIYLLKIHDGEQVILKRKIVIL